MTVLFAIDPSLNVVYYAAFGDCSISEFLEVAQQDASNPLRKPGMLMIIDMLAINELNTEVADFRRTIAHFKRLMKSDFGLEKTAIISFSEGARIIGNTLKILGDELPIQIEFFYTLDQAIDWLGLTKDEKEIQRISAQLRQQYASKSSTSGTNPG